MDTGLVIHTVLGLLLLLIPAGALYLLERQMLKSFGLAVGRMMVQLLAVCLMVWGLIRVDSAWLSGAWLLAMAAVGLLGAEALQVRPIGYGRCRAFSGRDRRRVVAAGSRGFLSEPLQPGGSCL